MLWIATVVLDVATFLTALIAAYYWYESSVVPVQEFEPPIASVSDNPAVHILNTDVNLYGIRSALNRSGFIAKFWEKPLRPLEIRNCRIRSGSEAKQPGDEESLADCISFCQPSHSALSDHVHRFDSSYRPLRALKRAITFGQPHSFLHSPVVLFDYIVEILTLA